MSLTESFLTAVRRRMATEPLTPDVLARIVAELLPVDAVGITTMVDGVRLPLGASDTSALVAEQLQTTLGDGPCLTAARTGRPAAAGGEDIVRRWPVYGEALASRTPFRSVAAIPLGPPDDPLGALELYAGDADLPGRLDLVRVSDALASVAATLLAVCLAQVPEADDDFTPVPLWYEQSTTRRHQVWIAMGMLLAYEKAEIVSNQDALVLLRGYAFGHGLSLDDLAHGLVTGGIGVHELHQEPI